MTDQPVLTMVMLQAWTQKAATAMESHKKELAAYKAKQADASDDASPVVEEKKEQPTKGKKRTKAEPKVEAEEEKAEEEPKKKRGRQSAKESKPAAKETSTTKKASKAKKSS